MTKYIVLLLTFISQLANAQYKAEEFEPALLEAKYGALLVYNGQANSFSLKFVSKSFEPTDQPNFIIVDGILMQSSITPFTQQFDFQNLDTETQKKLLTGWKAYEEEWVEEQLKTELEGKTSFIDISNRPFLYWVYDMPKSKSKDSVDKQVYLVAICFDQLLILSGPVVKGKKEETVKEKLMTIAKTLTLYPNQKQDIKKLYDELKK